jgi:putative endonuclease
MPKQPCVYILASQPHGTLYIGVTCDLVRRLHEHRSGTTAGFTSAYAVHRLMRYELFEDMLTAIAREKQLKRWHRPWKINLIESDNPEWHDLAPGLGVPSIPPRVRRDGP